MLVENVLRSQPCNHTKIAEHTEVKDTGGGKTSSQKHDHWFRCCWEEALKTLKVSLVLVMKNTYLVVIKYKRAKAGEKNRGTIEEFEAEASSWIATVGASHSSGEESHDSLRAEILPRILGMLPSTDLMMPTCSAEDEKPISCPLSDRVFDSSGCKLPSSGYWE